MPIEYVTRAVAIDDLAVMVTAYRWICDRCGFRETFPDSPMPEGRSEFDARRRGWGIFWDAEDLENCSCPTCRALYSHKIREKLADITTSETK